MKINKKSYLKIKLFIQSCLFILITFSCFNYFRNNSIFFMPREYKTIKKIVDKIASKNYLGDQEIPFSIGSGTYMEYEAEKLGLCKKNDCYYFKNLNPYKRQKFFNKVDLNELSKQAYLFNSIEAYAWNGIVWLSKSTFRTYGEKTNFLSCVIGHELSHIIYNDHIEQSIKLSKKLKELDKFNDRNKRVLKSKSQLNIEEFKSIDDEEIFLFEKLLSRESEMNADRNGTKMIINTGYSEDTCLKSLKFLAKRNYLYAHTELESTHPGHIERYESLKIFTKNYNKENEIKNFRPYKWDWIYNRNSNTLTFSPTY